MRNNSEMYVEGEKIKEIMVDRNFSGIELKREDEVSHRKVQEIFCKTNRPKCQ